MGFKPGNQIAFAQISNELKTPFTGSQTDHQFWYVAFSERAMNIGAYP
jgi:hypothetical protein